MSERLSALDVSFLHLEERTTPLHAGLIEESLADQVMASNESAHARERARARAKLRP
jgi:hypothetical protein